MTRPQPTAAPAQAPSSAMPSGPLPDAAPAQVPFNEYRYSLRRRLLGVLISTLALLWLATLGAAFLRAHAVADDIFDAHLEQTAHMLLAAPFVGAAVLPPVPASHLPPANDAILFQVWETRPGLPAHLLFHAAGANDGPLTRLDGFSETQWRGDRWRFYSERSPDGRRQVQVAQSHDIRFALAQDAAIRLLLPLLAGLPLLALAAWIAVSRSLAPLGRIAAHLEQRRPEATEPVARDALPDEVAPLVTALDRLFARIGRVLENERQFTANAAHELRTPLASLKTQAQVALRAPKEETRERALHQVLEGADRLGRLVDQLLTLARLDPTLRECPGRPVDLLPIAREVLAQQAPAALERGVSLALEAPPEGTLPTLGNPDLLAILLRNLVDNGVRYSAPAAPGQEGQVRVRLERTPGGAVLRVTDSGPGIPADQREAALGRFTRLAPERAEGSGLGLSIVARIAALHGASLSLAEGPEGRGLAVTVGFPPREPGEPL